MPHASNRMIAEREASLVYRRFSRKLASELSTLGQRLHSVTAPGVLHENLGVALRRIGRDTERRITCRHAVIQLQSANVKWRTIASPQLTAPVEGPERSFHKIRDHFAAST